MTKDIKINALPLFPVLEEKLISLLKSLTAEEWNTQTVARLWKVKDVAAHLLDGNLRGLSISRDGYYGENPGNINSYEELVAFLNHLNLLWTNAAKRISPCVLINLLEITGREYIHHLSTLRPLDNAVFAVAWAGHETSQNWFHIAREYTEKFLHQQQIRDAVGKQGIMTEELYRPFLDTLMFAFPYTFRNTSAKEGTVVSVKITTDIGGTWSIVKTADRWLLLDKNQPMPTDAQVILDPDTAWKLFSKSLQPEQVMDKVELDGNEILAQQVLKIVAVMA